MSSVRPKIKRTKGGVVLPVVDRAMIKLGQDINVARRARNISTADMASRMSCSRSTLHRLESGDAGVSLNTLARALHVLGIIDRLSDLVEHSQDGIGMMMQRRSLPERITKPRKKTTPSASGARPENADDHDDEPEQW